MVWRSVAGRVGNRVGAGDGASVWVRLGARVGFIARSRVGARVVGRG